VLATPTVDELAGALIRAFVPLSVAEAHLAVSAYRLLAEGRPVEPAVLAEATGWTPAEVDAQLTSWPGVYRDDAGRLVGFWGLATEAVSGHHLEVEGAGTVWAWCAFDPLFIAPVLESQVRVTSPCPQTGTTIRLTVDGQNVRDLDPPAAVMSFLVPDRPFDAEIRQTFCHFVHVLASPTAAEDWRAKHPGTFWLPLGDAVEVARRVTAAVFPRGT
jgi:alkylmercury lyase